MIRVVIGPGFPFPIGRPSALITGMISAAVPVRKHSSATKTSCRVMIRFSNLEVQARAAISKTTDRVIPRKRSGRNRRSEDLAVLDDEHIVGRAFGHVARVVQHQRFIRAGEVRFDPRHHVVQID